MSNIHRVGSRDAMRDVATNVAAGLRGGEVFLLVGELGTGKTTFVQALAAALGVTGPVTSPSFTIVTSYPTAHERVRELVHADLYRLTPEHVANDPAVRGLREQAGAPDAVTVVEWADRLPADIWPAAHRFTFTHGATDSERIIHVD